MRLNFYFLSLAILYGSAAFGMILSPAASYPAGCERKKLDDAVASREFSTACSYIDRWIDRTKEAKEISFLLVEKAKLLYAAQRHVEAEEVFLEGLAHGALFEADSASQMEREAFEELLPEYFLSSRSPQESELFFQKVQKAFGGRQDYFLLQHYVAASLANCGRMIEFFDCFAAAYKCRPHCYLRWKTVGVLHLRLFEGSVDETSRERHRREAVSNLSEAFRLQPDDSSLLVKIMFLLLPDERRVFIREAAASLMAHKTPVRRSDCFFLIQQAIDGAEMDIAKLLIEKAHSWYEYSRALEVLSAQWEAKSTRSGGGEGVSNPSPTKVLKDVSPCGDGP